MRKIIICSLIIALLASCDNITTLKAKRKSIWKITEINLEEGAFVTYRAEYLYDEESSPLNVKDTWFTDSLNKFSVGDTLSFSK